jgi:hypothetical protein
MEAWDWEPRGVLDASSAPASGRLVLSGLGFQGRVQASVLFGSI